VREVFPTVDRGRLILDPIEAQNILISSKYLS
jgi:hypothetical protein